MNLYIEVKDGKTLNHPVAEVNLRQFFPKLNGRRNKSIPPGFARFVRKPVPITPDNMRLDYIEYVLDDELTKTYDFPTYTDNYVFRPYTVEEREQLIAEYKKIVPSEKDWIYDQATNSLVPPIPKPNDGKPYVWLYPEENETQGRWAEIGEVHPDDPEIVLALRSIRELQQELGLTDEAHNAATEGIITAFLESKNKGQ